MRIPPEARPATLLQHFAEEEKLLGAVVPPIFQNSLFVFDTYEEYCEAWQKTPEGPPAHYSRIGNPTLSVVEKKLAMLEGTEAAKVTGSGMAAISAAVFSVIEAGAHVVAVRSCYKPARQLFSDYLPKFGVSTTYVDGRNVAEVVAAIRPQTCLVYLESPTTALFHLQDLAAIAAECRARGVATICDNSYASPLYQNPAKFGVDIVVHTASKYLGGHSDLVGGAICTSRERMDRLVAQEGEIPLLGGVMAPLVAWLLLRGMRTLELRVRRHEETANRVAAWLSQRPEVAAVHHLGLPTYPQRELFERQMQGSGGLFSFELRDSDAGRLVRLVNALRLFRIGVSWGGFESLAMIMATHEEPPRQVVRLYCGLEDPEDLIADLERALEASA